MNEQFASVSLDANESQTPILALLDEQLSIGYAENRYKHGHNPRVSFINGLKQVRIKVTFSGGRNKEWGRKLEYVLTVIDERRFQFRRLV